MLASTHLLGNKNYKQLATELRRTVLKMTNFAQSSHIGSNFSSADILTVLYDIADFTPTSNGMTKDIVVVKSWNAANVYACLVRRGLLPQEAIDRYGEEGTPWVTILDPVEYNGIKVVPFGTGAMGYHLPAAVGFALAKKLKGEEGTVYCLISDGELNIGSTWESLLIAGHHKLNNLVVLVDFNGFQAMGKTKEILKFPDFTIGDYSKMGWDGCGWDGHNYAQILQALKLRENPSINFMNTIKGKGVSFMENENLWHYSHVNNDVLAKALGELNAI